MFHHLPLTVMCWLLTSVSAGSESGAVVCGGMLHVTLSPAGNVWPSPLAASPVSSRCISWALRTTENRLFKRGKYAEEAIAAAGVAGGLSGSIELGN